MNPIKVFRENLKYLLPAFGKYKKDAKISMISTVIETIIELMLPFIMAKIVDDAIALKDVNLTIKYGIIMIILSLLCMFCGTRATKYAGISAAGFGYNLRNIQYKKIQTFAFEDIEEFSTSSLITRMTTDIQTIIMSVFMTIRFMMKSPIMLIVAVFLTLRINASLSMVFLVSLPVLLIAIYLIAKIAIPQFSTFRSQFDRINLTVEENLENIRVVKSFVKKDSEIKKFKNESNAMFKLADSIFGLLSSMFPFSNLIMFATIVAIVWFGGNHIIQGKMGVGELTSFVTYSTQILMSLIMMSMVLIQVMSSTASIIRISKVLKHVASMKDSDDKSIKVEDGSIDFENVFFKYDLNSENYALSGVNLHIKSGEQIGILGETGSSKSTLVQLIPRLYDVSQGIIKVSGKDVKDYNLENLRNDVAIVLQKNTLFSGTIRENLKWGKLDATDEELKKVCEISCADEFIQKRDGGLDSVLGQGGSGVSGGQKQRLCIARALLKKPKILIMDNSTSAVDTTTDSKIKEGLKEFSKDMTTIIIAQRINSIKNCDRIIMMKDGRIEDIGTHDYLYENNETYRDIYQAQEMGAEDEQK
ncbi:MAG: ABC transporter ATP-binding protein [Tissierellia bacterium]|nr:ABC transporter ATP-binding protein [Tissierellia bacterium]